jgi:phosphoglycolate phosphatase-like HAD superfamily hydrolase
MIIGLDLDGTLLDSRARHVEALRRAAAALSISISNDIAESYLELKRNGQNGRQALEVLGVPRSREITKIWVEIIESRDLLSLDRPYPNALDGLREAIHRGHAFVLATCRQDSSAVLDQISGFGLEQLLDSVHVIDPRSHCRTKAAATREFRLEAIAGDTEVDHQWAIESGARFYASAYGFRSREFWARMNVRSYDFVADLIHSLTTGGRDCPVREQNPCGKGVRPHEC